MKSFTLSLALVALLSLAGCAESLHKPTTAANAGTTALVAYSIAGAGVGQYLALPFCAAPAVYPCKTPALNQQLATADTAAYNAAVAADNAAGNAQLKAASDHANAQLRQSVINANASANGSN